MERGYGLLGEKLTHSYSPRIHQALGDYPYKLYEKRPEELADFLLHADFSGLNVTIPYKQSVIPFCNALTAAAQAIGSVNTLIRQPDGSLVGDNTDADGFREMLHFSGCSPQGKKALIFGSGGASLTAGYVLREMGAQPVITVSRTGENNYQNLYRLHADAQILVNTTPLGMYPHTGMAPADAAKFPKCEAVLDVIYNPARTRLLLDAEKAGIPCCDGLVMLVRQAMEAARRWGVLSEDAPSSQDILSRLRAQMCNVILVGMPGSGKTTVGKELARLMQRPLVDADEELVKRIQMSIPEFFARFGEDAFRREETAVLSELGKQSGLVLATGGGCVTRPENYELLHQNGTIIFLQRDCSLLAQEGRPLSLTTDLNEMYAKRLPLYEQFADAAVENAASPLLTAQKIQEVFHEITGFKRP